MLKAIAFWEFSVEDFADWTALVGSAATPTYAAYLDLLAAAQADQERQGRRLTEANLPNTPDARATIIAQAAAKMEPPACAGGKD